MGDEYGEVVGGVDRLSSKVRNQKVDPRDYHVIMKSILLTYSRRELVDIPMFRSPRWLHLGVSILRIRT